MTRKEEVVAYLYHNSAWGNAGNLRESKSGLPKYEARKCISRDNVFELSNNIISKISLFCNKREDHSVRMSVIS
jgi:hypothetical protein